jgi:alkyl hydroperoxide reductase subunit D
MNMQNLETLFESRSSVISRDLKLNLQRLLSESSLDKSEAQLVLLATATSTGAKSLASFAEAELRELGMGDDEVREARESAAIMGMLNTYYRFRHMIESGQGEAAKENYKTAGLRMTSLAKPVLGKERFEMLAFAVSVLNGCESCINAHEQALKHAGVSTDKIHDLARLAAVVKGLSALDL